ncbi:MAG TPA: diguanylate cyclase, partial [Steroidobacteraceae bacterium]
MRKKILWAACLLAVALIVGVFYSARVVLSRSFASIEADAARQSTERVRQALQADLRQLDVAAEDNALWDDLYDFVQGNRPDFLDHTFSRRSLDNIHVDVVWVFDDSGRTLVQLAADGDPAGGVKSLDAATLRSLQGYLSLLETPDGPTTPTLRLLRTPAGAMAVAAHRIFRNSRVGPSVGMLVFGRYLHTGLIERLEQTSQSPVRATILDEDGRPRLSVPTAVGEWLAGIAHGPDLLIQTGDPATLRTHALLRDIEGRPLVVLSTTVARTALQIGKRTITWVVAALLCGFAVVVALLVSLLNRSWRSRAAAQRQWLDHQRKMSRLARRDALTGLPNRLHLQRLLPRLLARAARDGTRLALLNLDLDHFKNVNDSLGHGSGDRLLAAVARRLRASVAAHDVVVRMGGDEFVIVATELLDSVSVDSIAERIRSA